MAAFIHGCCLLDACSRFTKRQAPSRSTQGEGLGDAVLDVVGCFRL